MSPLDPQLRREAFWFCSEVCRLPDKVCPITQVEHSGLNCPLWRFLNRHGRKVGPHDEGSVPAAARAT